ncbi:hypothetical protein [Paeniglutamicibacter sp. NPDC091659]|uniref:hypothetical protein n=1 Tax=Paeniglutamicibacter sp. NPDC091659 TaxID=3364389 RepID=UPI0038223B55
MANRHPIDGDFTFSSGAGVYIAFVGLDVNTLLMDMSLAGIPLLGKRDYALQHHRCHAGGLSCYVHTHQAVAFQNLYGQMQCCPRIEPS